MSNPCGDSERTFRDGTSQQGRRMAALDPSYFSVEERTTEDLIRFARKFAAELKFFNLDNEEDGDWTGFLGKEDPDNPESEEKLQDLLAYIENPEQTLARSKYKDWLTRPHLSLFLTFLEMLKGPKRLLDDLTRRHLDFYYRDVLRIPEKPAVPDKVHVMFEPARGVESHLVKAGTLLYAGKDSAGNDLHYATDDDLVVSQAKVSDIRRVYRDTDTGQIYADISWQEGEEIPPDRKYHVLGVGLEEPTEGNPNLANIGFAICSPLLELSEGQRTIVLSFTVPGDSVLSVALIKKAFAFSLSTEEGWWEILPSDIPDLESDAVDPSDPREVIVRINVGGAPATVPPAEETADFPFPVLRAAFNQLAFNDDEVDIRQELMSLQATIQLSVEVMGMTALVMRNEEGVISPESSFLPFGGWPRVGSSFTFSHTELCRKPITKLALHIEWKIGSPALEERYQLYIDKDFMELPFKVILRSNAGDTGIEKDLFDDPMSFETLGDFNLASDLQYPVATKDDPLEYSRYFYLRLLEPDFQHSNFPLLLYKLSNENRNGNGNGGAEVYPPYTPEIQSFTLDYTTRSEFLTPYRDSRHPHVFYHWHPFGYACTCTTYSGGEIDLLPVFPESGNLYVGLVDVVSSDYVSLLFQLHPGYSDEDPPKIQWSYLDNNCWQSIPEKQIWIDRTRNLLGTGLVRIKLPEARSLDHQVMPAGCYWLCASSEQPKAVGDLVAVHAQAITGTWINQGNASDHLNVPLPAESVTELKRRDPNIKSILQPYTSFGSRPEEQEDRYRTRVSERLRHKQRALTGWDYERLVLDRFPEVYKVKCLTTLEKSLLLREEELSELSDVLLVVIPNFTNKAPFFPLEPRLSNEKREEIKKHLQRHASAFSRIKVRNPRFEYIRYRMDIRFHQGYDENLYSKKLNEALHRFLCPWAYESGSKISFGSRIYHSEVIYFIENLPYVDYVVNFKLARQYDQDDEDEWGCIEDSGCVVARHPDSILVAHQKHFIGSVPIDEYDPVEFIGVGYDRIGVDLIIYK